VRVVGVDPGLDGALAVVTEFGVVSVHDLPTIGGGPDGRRQLDALAFRDLLVEIGQVAMVVVEQLHAMPKNGSQTAFSQGDTFGVIRGITQAFDRPLTIIGRAAWHKAVGFPSGAGKEWALAKVRAEHPEVADRLARKMDADRAEAVLIAEAWMRTRQVAA
jgi:crossover junction endodeoxyribonuclease RuvC